MRQTENRRAKTSMPSAGRPAESQHEYIFNMCMISRTSCTRPKSNQRQKHSHGLNNRTKYKFAKRLFPYLTEHKKNVYSLKATSTPERPHAVNSDAMYKRICTYAMKM